MPISRPAVSRHLRLLKDAGLVAEQAEGTRRIYHLQERGHGGRAGTSRRVWGDAAARFRLLAENTDERPAMTTPCGCRFDVACSAAHAFDVWTARIGAWWPPDHTVTGTPAAVVLEAGVGGRIYERAADGVEHDWGEVTDWGRPTQLAYLWHLGGPDRRHRGRDPVPARGAPRPGSRSSTAAGNG